MAGVGYKAALRKLEKIHTTSTSSMPDQDSINQIEDELDNLEKSAPVVPEAINHTVEERYKDYNFVPRAADLRPGPEDRK